MRDISPVDRVISKALDTEVGRQFLNEFKGVLSKVLIFSSITLTLFFIFKVNSWLSVLGREGEAHKIEGG